LSHEWAIQELKKFAGIQFDPVYVEAFINAFEKDKQQQSG
jgi:HD-GYP domain-containing protein (c-di-GMP phosphodiesterase class II)